MGGPPEEPRTPALPHARPVVPRQWPRLQPVVVGLDGEGDVLPGGAVEWAAAEAAALCRPLRLVQAVRRQGRAARVLDEALARAAVLVPDGVLEADVEVGRPGPVLAERSRGASLVVVGRGSRVRPWGAACPVAVVPAPGRALRPRTLPRVVVGVGDGPGDTLRHAVDAARRRGVGVTAVRAWTPASAVEPGSATAEELDAPRAEAAARLRAAVRGADVPVTGRLSCGSPASALVAASAGAALVVVGAPRHRHAWTRPVAMSVAARASCTVVVVPVRP